MSQIPLLDTFGEREIEILRLLAEGRTNREIAAALVISPETVKWYNKQIFSKLGVSSRDQAVTVARSRGLLADGSGEASALAGNLPAEVSSFVGRNQELAEVLELLGRTRLLTLTGPGGTGKTRLGLQAARRLTGHFADGIYFVALPDR